MAGWYTRGVNFVLDLLDEDAKHEAMVRARTPLDEDKKNPGYQNRRYGNQ